MFLSKKPNGYYYLYYFDDNLGKRISISTKSKKKSEANKFLIDFKDLRKKEIEEINNHPRVNPYLKLSEYQLEINNFIKNYLSTSTIRIYNLCFKFMLEIIGNKPLKLISNDDIEHYISSRLRIVRKTTVNIEIRTIKAIMNIGIRWGIVNKKIIEGIRIFKIEQKPRLCFNEEEINLILTNIDVKILNVVKFALYTGCRINEIVNIQWKDVNLIQRIIIITNKEDFKTKSRKIRKIPVSDKLYSILNQMYDDIRTNENLITNFDILERYIFENNNNAKLDRTYITKKFKKTLRMLNLPEKYHFHCLRHTFITTLARRGVNLYDIKELAGHSDIQTTEIYLHSVTEDLRNAVNKI